MTLVSRFGIPLSKRHLQQTRPGRRALSLSAHGSPGARRLAGESPPAPVRRLLRRLSVDALVLFAVFAFYAVFKDASAAERLSTACLSLAAGAYGTWARRLAQSESQILAAQHQRDMERMAFDAEGDRRRRNNETISALLRKLDALPAKGRERIISECLTLLRNMQQRTNPPGKAAS